MGYINKSGDFVIEPRQLDLAFQFDVDGFALVMINEKYGIIDTIGNFIIEPVFDATNCDSALWLQ